MTEQCQREFEKWLQADGTHPPIQKIWEAAWTAREETIYPVFDTLERLCEQGYKTKKQDGQWWLFDPEGNGVTFGTTFRSMCLSIILIGL